MVFALLLIIAPAHGVADATHACNAWGPPSLHARLQAPQVDESSGLARSEDGQTWYTHDDSGGNPEIFAFDLSGQLLATMPVPGAQAIDWEDMAAGPCPEEPPSGGVGGDNKGTDGRCLYLGDIGDNNQERTSIQVYAVALEAPTGPARLVGTWNLRYPDGPRNAEALLVHPHTGAITVVTKSSDGTSAVMRAPAAPGAAALTQVGTVQIDAPSSPGRKITGGDWSSDGTQVVLRTYTRAWQWSANDTDPDAHWAATPTPVELRIEAQGEAIAFASDGRLVTTSEGVPMPLTVLPCAKVQP